MEAVASVYDDKLKLLRGLAPNQLKTVHSIVVEFAESNDNWSSPLGIETEDQLWSHIDHSLGQAKAGQGRDADIIISELAQEFSV